MEDSSSTTTTTTTRILQFAPFQSLVDEGFWHRFSSLKLNTLRIDDSPLPITGFYAPCSHARLSNQFNLFAESLAADKNGESIIPARGNRNRCPVPGTFYNMNTFEAYRALDKKKLMKDAANKIWDDIHTGKALEDSAVLLRFFLISFSDLKKWSFHYWFAFPALEMNPPALLVDLKPASQWFTAKEAESVTAACNQWRNSSLTSDVPFFLVTIASNWDVSVKHLKDWEACQANGLKVLFGFYDPCHLPNNPGWPLRNYLALICSRWNLKNVLFFCYRENRGHPDLGLSLVGEALITVPQDWKGHQCAPNAVGWERTKDKYVSRCINLAKSMDPTRLAVAAADLNLKLMRWRALPSLDLDKLSSMKCLLLGAGALGSQVARMLMSWGVRKITLVDNGRVAMPNPLRQSLYTLDDCLNGGDFKAMAAFKTLKRIFPAVEAEGVVLSIPMPGHLVRKQEEESVIDDCRRLHDLVDSHDVVFLLTNTRESRWLPTLLCANANKMTITASLGFDSFLVMRHGPGPFASTHDVTPESLTKLSAEMKEPAIGEGGRRLGCYFCNDSAVNHTPAQQHAVPRPGLAPIASSLAVELFVNILHHPNGIYTEGEITNSSCNNSSEQPLGILPHQIRGLLHQFSQTSFVGYSSNSCTACCSTIVAEYRERGMEFLLQAFNHPTYLEDLTGLTESKNSAEAFKLERAMDNDDAYLNLKLMRLHAAPFLDFNKLSSMKCLLLGAGTLGCQVARMLMACGVQTITLVDNGRVAMSNPLRQSLYTFNDCLNGGDFKALAAVKSLESICPAVEAKGVVMSIPMPGHPVTKQEEESVVDDCRRLHELVGSHDIVFLLTDTRESRWLPTLLCANSNKMTITAALGFDSFLVMRHGPGPFASTQDVKPESLTNLSAEMEELCIGNEGGHRLGCYFCNDVVAPTDSTANRTLDQQCTVTRPGLAPIVSSLAVELFVNILHHPNGIYTEGAITNSNENSSSEQPLGILPHQLRGLLHQFSQMTLVGYASNSCTACSGTVVAEYRKRGMEFLLQAFNHPTYLEDLTGLTELKKAAETFELEWDMDNDDDDCVEI